MNFILWRFVHASPNIASLQPFDGHQSRFRGPRSGCMHARFGTVPSRTSTSSRSPDPLSTRSHKRKAKCQERSDSNLDGGSRGRDRSLNGLTLRALIGQSRDHARTEVSTQSGQRASQAIVRRLCIGNSIPLLLQMKAREARHGIW